MASTRAEPDSDSDLRAASVLNTLDVFDPVVVPPDPSDRRVEGRRLLAVRAEITPLGPDLKPLARPAEATVVDISKHGIGVTADVRRRPPYFSARLTTARGHVIERLYRTHSTDLSEPVSRLGGVVVTPSDVAETRDPLTRDVLGLSLVEWLLFLCLIAFCLRSA